MSSWGVGAIDGVDGLEGATAEDEGVIGNCGVGLDKDSGTDDASIGVNTRTIEEPTAEDEGVICKRGVGLGKDLGTDDA